MKTFYFFLAAIAVSILVRIAIDKWRKKQGKSQIGWLFAFITFFTLNSFLVNFEKSQLVAIRIPTGIGISEWIILLSALSIILLFILKKILKKLKRS